eukprot:479058-Rhodomonas_salina.1
MALALLPERSVQPHHRLCRRQHLKPRRGRGGGGAGSAREGREQRGSSRGELRVRGLQSADCVDDFGVL